MADEFLDDIDDDFEDTMEDILDSELDDLADNFQDDSDDSEAFDDMDDSAGKGKKSFLKKLLENFQLFFKKILGSKKLIIIISAVIVLLVLIIIGLFLFLGGEDEKSSKDNSQVNVQVGDNPGALTQAPEIIFEDIVDLEPFERISLKSSSSMELVSITLSLELTDHRYRKQIYTMGEQIRKIVTDHMAQMTWLELKNPEGKIMLKYSLLQQINSIFPKATVRNIYFTNFIMQ